MFVLTEVILQRAIKDGLKSLSNDPTALEDVFAQYCHPKLDYIYGNSYIDSIKSWVSSTKIPVLQAWSFDATRVPCVSIHLGNEMDDESKAAIGDYWGLGDTGEVLVNPMTVMLDIGIHADKSKDHVLWLYYMVNHILYKEKTAFRDLGLQLITFNASDYNKESKYMAENVWTRWIRFRCTVQNYIGRDDLAEVDDVNMDMTISNPNDPTDQNSVSHP